MRTAHVFLALGLIAASCSGDGDAETVTDAGSSEVADTTSDTTDDDTAGQAEADTPTSTSAPGDPADDAEEDAVASTTTEPSGDDEPTTESPSTSLQLNPTTTKAPATPSAPVGSDRAEFAGSIDPGLAGFVDMATADLAGRLGVEAATIEAVSAVLVTWPDSAIGCPLPGMEYLQAQQDGSIIELELDGTFYRYHSGGDQAAPFLCPANRATSPS